MIVDFDAEKRRRMLAKSGLPEDWTEERWAKECAEWETIRVELLERLERGERDGVTAFDVTHEQHRRMLERGERPIGGKLAEGLEAPSC